MSGSLARAAPVRFLIGVTLVWTVGRGVALAGWQPDAVTLNPPSGRRTGSIAISRPLAQVWRPEMMPASITLAIPPLLRRLTPWTPPTITRGSQGVSGYPAHDSYRPAGESQLVLAVYRPNQIRSSGIVAAKAIAGTTKTASRLSGSAWAFVRGGGRATILSPVGQIGGGQAGARILYAIDRPDRLSLSARVSHTIGGITQSEAAVGLDWKPLAHIPIHLMLERRIAIDKGGRDAWTLGATGGVDDVHIARGWRLDGYGEAGVVGAHRRDLYADGAARVARAIDLGGGRSLSLGGGAWGAAQPHAARLDLGPSAVLRAPVAGRFLAVALDWRERIVGSAKPGSGIALTVATDF